MILSERALLFHPLCLQLNFFKTVRVRECKGDAISWLINSLVECETECDEKSIISIVPINVVRNSFPFGYLSSAILDYPEYRLQSHLVELALVVHISDWETKWFTILCTTHTKVEPCSIVSLSCVRQWVFAQKQMKSALIDLTCSCKVTTIKAWRDFDLSKHESVLLWVSTSQFRPRRITMWSRHVIHIFES